MTRTGTIAMLAGLNARNAKYQNLDDPLMGKGMWRRDTDVSGDKMQFEIRTALPATTGALARTGAPETLVQSLTEGFTFIGGELPYSYYQFDEVVRTAKIEAFQNNPESMADYIGEISTAITDSIMLKLNEDLIPALPLYPSYASGFTGGAAAENKIMALGYPLQTGQASNGAGTSTSYSYAGIDIGTTYSALRATAPTPLAANSLTATRRAITYPLQDKGAKPDIMIADSAIYDGWLVEAEAKTVIGQEDYLKYGGTYREFPGGVMGLREGRLDTVFASAAATRVIYALQSSSWYFALKGSVGNDVSFELHDVPGTTLLKRMTGHIVCGFACTNPRVNARVYGVTTPL